jgi:hypothetical protein
MAGGNLRRTAALLGISYRSLRHLISKFGLRETEKIEPAAAQQNIEPLH